jgi:outer membrane lipoprotein-sorting protein
MYIKTLFLSTLVVLASFEMSAQNTGKAEQILTKASEAYNKSGGIKATFSIQMLSRGGSTNGKISGSIQLKGPRFKISTSDMITWFDGNNQWVYIKANEEVNLSKPTQKELLTINPINIFQLYKHGYSCKLLGEKTEKGARVYQIEMKPSKNEGAQTILVKIDKTTYYPIGATTTNKDKSGTIVQILSYQTKQNYPDGIFTFNPKNHPDAEVIDLR